jgi:gliding motility-associated-like protein
VEGEPFQVNNIQQSPYLLPATLQGAHQLTWVADAGCEGEVSGSAWVEVNAISITAEVTNASCSAGTDGRLKVSLGGGTPPYDWFWLDTAAPDLEREQLSPGTYTIIVKDDKGCEKEATFEVNAPPPLQPLQFDCESISSGSIKATATGGTPPYQYAINDGPFGGAELLDLLTPGEHYLITIRDAMGCEVEQSTLWPAAYERIADFPPMMELKLGLAETLQPQYNIPFSLISSIRWSPANGLSCTDCPFPTVQIAHPETYTLRIVDLYGCSTELTIAITIDESIDIYVPTAFSPNGDQVNDRLNIYANTLQVEKVLVFRIFDRWGGLMFENENFPPNREQLGWDGTFRGQLMDPGVYTYMAILELASGARQTIGGHVLLMQ